MKMAVIPARGGSKRIPRKNIRPFAGLPIIGHSIRAALADDHAGTNAVVRHALDWFGQAGRPVQRALTLSADGSVAPMHPEHAATRSQDLPHADHDAGQFYWGRARAFLDDIPLFSAASMAVVLPRHTVQDIDTLEDWTPAEFMYEALKSAGEIAT